MLAFSFELSHQIWEILPWDLQDVWCRIIYYTFPLRRQLTLYGTVHSPRDFFLIKLKDIDCNSLVPCLLGAAASHTSQELYGDQALSSYFCFLPSMLAKELLWSIGSIFECFLYVVWRDLSSLSKSLYFAGPIRHWIAWTQRRLNVP